MRNRRAFSVSFGAAGLLAAVAARQVSPNGGLWHLRAGVWTQIWGSAQAQFAFDVALDPTNANRIAIVTNDNPWHDRMGSSGVWLSTNGGTSFSQQNTNLPMNRGGTIAFDPVTSGKLIVGLNGRGFWTARF